MSKWGGNFNLCRWKSVGRRISGNRIGQFQVRSNESGFTLIETLIVLSIFLIISTISALLLKPHFLYLEKQLFLNQLKTDLYFAQQYAISHHHEVYVFIIPEQNMYYIRGRVSDEVLLKREISKEITILSGSQMLHFQFQPDGNISKFGSFHFIIGKEKYRMTFQIGRGRFYVQKE